MPVSDPVALCHFIQELYLEFLYYAAVESRFTIPWTAPRSPGSMTTRVAPGVLGRPSDVSTFATSGTPVELHQEEQQEWEENQTAR